MEKMIVNMISHLIHECMKRMDGYIVELVWTFCLPFYDTDHSWK